ncbi:MAG: Rieske 2Fe-2S domain-containing protein [Pseudomonadota bacterium]
MSLDGFTDIAAVDELPDKGFVVKAADDVQIVLARYDGGVHAVENLCSHAFARFDGGRLRGYRLMCPLHGACFDIRTGATMGPPAAHGIRSFPVEIVDDRVFVKLEA